MVLIIGVGQATGTNDGWLSTDVAGIGLQGGLQYEVHILRIIGYLRMILVSLSKNG
jgi:hypothetical protein